MTDVSSAARQRLLRFQAADQPTLGAAVDAVVDPILPVPDSDEEAQEAFTSLAADVRGQFVAADDPWRDSPYQWVKHLPSASRGKAGTALVHRWARSSGFDVTGRRGRGHDLVAGTARLEVKMSTRWASGEYTFQAVRDGAYETLVLLGVSPHRIHLWLVPRAAALSNVDRARAGWITVPAARPPRWLDHFGGTLLTARAVADRTWPARDGAS